MSLFSRLFKGPEDGDKDPEQEAAPAEGRAAERAKKPGHESVDGKGSMRPTAPSFNLQPPVSERSSQAATATVVEVGITDAKTSASPAAARSPKVSADSPPARGRSSSTTIVLGSNPSAPGPAASPQRKPASSGAQRAMPPPPPLPAAAHRASPPAAPAAQPARGAPPRSKLPSGVGLEAFKPPPDPPRTSPDDGASVDGLLTLELGPTAPTPASPRKGATTLQGPAPLAQGAVRTAADPQMRVSQNAANSHHSEVDAAFGAMVEVADNVPKRPTPPPSGGSVAELRELFASLAANHMRQVREFMIGVKWGEAPRDWIPICEPAVGSLARAAKEMELADLCSALADYRESLASANGADGIVIADAPREQLMRSYEKLVALMPDAFGLEGERGRRENIIVHALLQQVPDVRKVTIDKIYAAGLTNLDHLFVARPDEISATTGIGETLALQIVEKFQRYRREIASLNDATRTAERSRLGELAAELRGLNREFERASEGWSDDDRAEKRKFRQARAEALLQVKVLLARLGEIERLGQIDRLPFGRKIEELERYLVESKPREASVA